MRGAQQSREPVQRTSVRHEVKLSQCDAGQRPGVRCQAKMEENLGQILGDHVGSTWRADVARPRAKGTDTM